MLVIGACGLGAEVIKNLVLAGVNSLKILDHRKVTALDTYSNFLVPHDSIGQNVCNLMIFFFIITRIKNKIFSFLFVCPPR